MRHVLKNDQVEVISGDDKGKTGKVLKVIPDKSRVIVEKINMVKRHKRATQQGQKAGIIEKEAAIHLSTVLPICEKCKRGVRVGHRVAGDGRKQRVCRSCGQAIEQLER